MPRIFQLKKKIVCLFYKTREIMDIRESKVVIEPPPANAINNNEHTICYSRVDRACALPFKMSNHQHVESYVGPVRVTEYVPMHNRMKTIPFDFASSADKAQVQA